MSLRAGDRRLDVIGSTVNVPGEVELQHQPRRALAAAGRDEHESRDLHELPLERRGHVGGHRLRSCAGITGLDLNDGIVDRRQIADRQPEVRVDAEDDDGEAERHCHHGAADESVGKTHDRLRADCFGALLAIAAGALWMRTFAPDLTEP